MKVTEVQHKYVEPRILFLQAIPIIILVRHSIMIGEMAMKYTLGDIQLKRPGTYLRERVLEILVH